MRHIDLSHPRDTVAQNGSQLGFDPCLLLSPSSPLSLQIPFRKTERPNFRAFSQRLLVWQKAWKSPFNRDAGDEGDVHPSSGILVRSLAGKQLRQSLSRRSMKFLFSLLSSPFITVHHRFFLFLNQG
jgi:hypothetical protein